MVRGAPRAWLRSQPEVAMSIVAISQTLGSLGDEVGRELARTLSYEFADREIIFQAAERFGEGVTELQHATEEKPTLWERFTEAKEPYLTDVEAIIWEMAARDNVVLVGRGAPFLLRTVPYALRVRVTAPESLRAKRLENQEGLATDAARDIVRQSDRDRAARVKFLYQVGWDNALLYDLVLNTERLAVTEGVRMIQHALQNQRFQATSESRAQVKDLSLTASAKAALLADPRTGQLVLSLTCEKGYLSVGGKVEREELRQVVEEIVRAIPGVTGVENATVVAPRLPASAV